MSALKLKNITDKVLKVSTIGGRIDVHPGDNCLVAPEKAKLFLDNKELEIIPVIRLIEECQTPTNPISIDSKTFIAKESDKP